MVINVLNEFSLDFVVPISKVDESMLRCQEKDGVLNEKFWFRVDLFDHGDFEKNILQETGFTRSRESKKSGERVCKQLYLWQILEGDVNEHPSFKKGLVHLIQLYMQVKGWTTEH